MRRTLTWDFRLCAPWAWILLYLRESGLMMVGGETMGRDRRVGKRWAENCTNSIACVVKPRLSHQKSPNSFPLLRLHRLYVHGRTVNFILFACRSPFRGPLPPCSAQPVRTTIPAQNVSRETLCSYNVRTYNPANPDRQVLLRTDN